MYRYWSPLTYFVHTLYIIKTIKRLVLCLTILTHIISYKNLNPRVVEQQSYVVSYFQKPSKIYEHSESYFVVGNEKCTSVIIFESR